MPNTLGKNFNLCFSLIKRPHAQIPHSPQHNQKYYHYSNNSPFIKNFNSLYEDLTPSPLPPPPPTTSSYVSAPGSPSSASTDYMTTDDTTLDLTAAYASQRFFISSPGRSNSIVDSLSLSSSRLLSPLEDKPPAEVAGGVPVQTYSPDPFMDFRRSMQEMVEAREFRNMEVKEVWEYLQELLLSYLALNQKTTHKYIVGAFTDLVVNLMSPNKCDDPSSSPSSSSSFSYCDNGGRRMYDNKY